MTDRQPAVALLFDDAALSGHLREALVEQGARIVYEADLAGFAPAELVGASPDVVVVDLDEPSDDDLDRLYDTVEGGHPRLVFNDSDASRALEGWDRARWARHLAAKLVGDVPRDPPRPADAAAIEPRIVALSTVPAPVEEPLDEPVTGDLSIVGSHGYPDALDVPALDDAPAVVSMDAVPDIEGDVDEPLVFSTPLTSDDDAPDADPGELAAELEALLAQDAHAPLDTDGLDEVPSRPVELTELASLELDGFEVVDDEPAASAPAPEPGYDLSQFTLAGLDDAPAPSPAVEETPTLEIESRATHYTPPPVPAWELVDDESIVIDTPARPSSSDFGIEQVSAAEYLAQDVVDDGSVRIEPGLTLELVSMEEALSPRVSDPDAGHEMFLEGASRALRRVIAVVGAAEGVGSMQAFLQALPAHLPALLLVVAHHDDSEALVRALGRGTLATDGMAASHGDVVVVPRGYHVQVRRDGSLAVQQEGGAQGPSIDGALSALSKAFGSDALAIVFAGRGNDAVAGAQAVYDAGGRVWVEALPMGDDAGHMVAGVREERVAGYAGDAAALAARVIEEFA